MKRKVVSVILATAMVASMVAGDVTVDNGIETMPETAITVNDLGNIK